MAAHTPGLCRNGLSDRPMAQRANLNELVERWWLLSEANDAFAKLKTSQPAWQMGLYGPSRHLQAVRR